MEVTRVTLERSLSELASGVRDPVEGLFGPGSTFWEVQRHSVLFAGAARAALLQLAHPWVARAVLEHSAVAHDPIGRFRRTFGWVSPMVFGDLDSAIWSARSVHVVHGVVKGSFAEQVGPFPAGTEYRATDLSSTRWVHATLWDTSVRMYEEYVRPLSLPEKRSYYVETLRFAALFGLSPRDLPQDWEAFQTYVRGMYASPILTVNEDTRRLGDALLRPRGSLASPALSAYASWTARWLPPHLREAYGLPYPSRHAGARALEGWLRTQRYWPASLRYVPAYHAARARLLGRRRPGLVPSLVQRVVFGPSRVEASRKTDLRGGGARVAFRR